MEMTLILMELEKIRLLLTAYAIISGCALVMALVAISIYFGRRFDKWLDDIDKEDGG